MGMFVAVGGAATLRSSRSAMLQNADVLRFGASIGDPGASSQGIASQGEALQTFTGFYDSHNTGRGIWKWRNALDAYQRHWALLAGNPVQVAEVGVQSGGSMLMWKAVFGSSCHVYGLDINPRCLAFQDASTTITIADQGNPAMWKSFFSKVCSTSPRSAAPFSKVCSNSLDILVDDGGHEPRQMLTTFNSVFPMLNHGGYIVIEDIHGARYLQSFFKPTAKFLAEQARLGQVASIHVYPFVLMVKKAGRPNLPTKELTFEGAAVAVDSFDGVWREVQNPSTRGGHVVLENPGWGPLFTVDALKNFFGVFNGLHAGSWTSNPPGCASTPQSNCTTTIINNLAQNLISGYHIYPTKVVVEVPLHPPAIQAVRRGNEWITYS